ncbi:MAG: hypothetical protein ACO1OG_05605 [Devosia sp.]
MDRPLTVWAKILLRLGLVLFAIGTLPALAVQYIFTQIDGLIPALLLFSAAPLGAIILVIGAILFLAASLRR